MFTKEELDRIFGICGEYIPTGVDTTETRTKVVVSFNKKRKELVEVNYYKSKNFRESHRTYNSIMNVVDIAEKSYVNHENWTFKNAYILEPQVQVEIEKANTALFDWLAA